MNILMDFLESGSLHACFDAMSVMISSKQFGGLIFIRVSLLFASDTVWIWL